MTDPEIKVGDVCIDLVERGKVAVVGQPYGSVGEHQDHESYDIAEYKANALLDVKKAEGVFKCVYLPENPSTSFSGTYDFPRSRLARIPVEEANDSLDRPQTGLAIAVVRQLLTTYNNTDVPDDVHRLEVAIEKTFDEDIAKAVFELADVEANFGDGDSDG